MIKTYFKSKVQKLESLRTKVVTSLLTIFGVLFITFNSISNDLPEGKLNELEDSKPNIIFILVDDMGWNGLSSYGSTHVTTPNIDRLAEEGMKFTQAYVAPECTPTRAEFLSGQYGARSGMTQVHTNRTYPNAPMLTPKVKGKLPEDNYTIANMLQDAGYVTAISGKWHVGAASREEKKTEYGFNFVGTAQEKPWSQVDKDKATPAQTKEILEFIKQHRNQSFFAYLPYFNIHTPLQAPDSLVQKYVNRGYPESTQRFGDASEKPTAHFLAMTEFVDHWIGNLLEGLEALELSDETMVVFMSDNGALNRAWDNRPLRGAKGVLYEGGIRVPLIVRWPNMIPAGTSSDEPVHIVDMFATFQYLADGSVPESKTLDGVSLLPLLTHGSEIERDAIYWHHPHYIHDYGKTPSSAIRKGDYKLIYYYGDYLNTYGYLPIRGEPYGELIIGERVELFNIAEDPFEENDLSQQRADKKDELLQHLKSWLKKVNGPLPEKNEESNADKRFKIASW